MLETGSLLLHGRHRVRLGGGVVEASARDAVADATFQVLVGPGGIDISGQGVLDPEGRDNVVDDEPPVGEPPGGSMVVEVEVVGLVLAPVARPRVDVVVPRVDAGVTECIRGGEARLLLLQPGVGLEVVAVVAVAVVVVVVRSGDRGREEEGDMSGEYQTLREVHACCS